MRLKIVAVLPILFCGSSGVAMAGQSPAEINAVMEKIYAAEAGYGKRTGEISSRSISRKTDWSTQPIQFTWTPEGAGKLKCEGTTGDESWVNRFYFNNGVEYFETKSGGKLSRQEFRITHAWFTDENNHGAVRAYFATGRNDVEYEVIETVVQMGNRSVVLGKIRKKGTADDYQYNFFESLRLVK